MSLDENQIVNDLMIHAAEQASEAVSRIANTAPWGLERKVQVAAVVSLVLAMRRLDPGLVRFAMQLDPNNNHVDIDRALQQSSR